MSGSTPIPRSALKATLWRWRWSALALLIATTVLAANAHFLFLAISSQPDCVAVHDQNNGETVYQAAKHAC